MFRISAKRIFAVIGSGRLFLVYYDGISIAEYKLVLCDVSDLSQRNAFTEEVGSFFNGRSGVLLEVVFDTDPQYFTSKVVSKKIKGSQLYTILGDKLDVDYPGDGIKMFKKVQGSDATSMNDYLLTSVPLNEVVNFAFSVLTGLGCQIVYYHSAILQLSYLSVSENLKSHSLVDDTGDQKKKLYQIIGGGGQVGPSLSIYFSAISGFRQVLAVGSKVVSVMTTQIANLSDMGDVEALLRDFQGSRDYMRQSFSDGSTSLVRITVFFSQELLETVSPRIDHEKEDLYFVSFKSFQGTFAKKVKFVEFGSSASQGKDVDPGYLTSIALAISCSRSPSCRTPNLPVLKMVVFFNVARNSLLVCSAFFIFLIIVFQYLYSQSVPKLDDLNSDISGLRDEKHDLLQRFDQWKYYRNLSAFELNKLASQEDEIYSILGKVSAAISEVGSSLRVENYKISCRDICIDLGRATSKKGTRDVNPSPRRSRNPRRVEGSSPAESDKGDSLSNARFVVVAQDLGSYSRFLSRVKVVLYDYAVSEVEVGLSKKRSRGRSFSDFQVEEGGDVRKVIEIKKIK